MKRTPPSWQQAWPEPFMWAYKRCESIRAGKHANPNTCHPQTGHSLLRCLMDLPDEHGTDVRRSAVSQALQLNANPLIGDQPYQRATEKGMDDLVNLMGAACLERGHRTKEGETILHWEARHLVKDSLGYLLELIMVHKPKTWINLRNATTPQGNTPLHVLWKDSLTWNEWKSAHTEAQKQECAQRQWIAAGALAIHTDLHQPNQQGETVAALIEQAYGLGFPHYRDFVPMDSKSFRALNEALACKPLDDMTPPASGTPLRRGL